MHLKLLVDIVIVLGLSAATVLICRRLRVPSIVGFLAAGMLAGVGRVLRAGGRASPPMQFSSTPLPGRSPSSKLLQAN